MLMLTRKTGESLIIALPSGERVTITITDARASCARLGIDAPRGIAVNRGEVAARIEAEQRRD
jgi:carbon storage regulator